MFGILKFQTFLLVVLLFICSCTYLHGVFPAWLDRNKTGWAYRCRHDGHGCVPLTFVQTVRDFLAGGENRRAAEPICQPVLYCHGRKS